MSKHHRDSKRGSTLPGHTCTYSCTRGLTEENNDTQQYGHQSSSCEAIWEGQDLRVTWLHVSTAVASTHAYNQCTGAALNGVVIVWDHNGQEVHVHLTPAETSPPCHYIGSVIWGKMQIAKLDYMLELDVLSGKQSLFHSLPAVAARNNLAVPFRFIGTLVSRQTEA